MKQTEPFEELFIPRRELQISTMSVYRVYSDYKHFELVEAASALEALSISKKRNVYKIQRHDPLGDNVLHLNQVMNSGLSENNARENIAVENNIAPPAQAQKPEVAPEQIVDAPVAAAAAAEAAPLSNDDIDKLLNG